MMSLILYVGSSGLEFSLTINHIFTKLTAFISFFRRGGLSVSKIFISYSRNDDGTSSEIASDVKRLGNEVWLDQELSGGQEWWDQILTNIRDSDIIIVVISEDSLNSDACEREYKYALALGKPVIPVMIDKSVSTKLLPRELASLEIVDFTVSDKEAAISLARAISMAPSPTSLPNPLPLAPEVPISYLGELSERVNSSETLSAEEQATLLVDVKTSFRNATTSTEGRALLEKMLTRKDLLASIAEEIKEALEGRIKIPKNYKKNTLLEIFLRDVALFFNCWIMRIRVSPISYEFIIQ